MPLLAGFPRSGWRDSRRGPECSADAWRWGAFGLSGVTYRLVGCHGGRHASRSVRPATARGFAHGRRPLGIGLRGHAGGGREGPVVMLDLSRLTPRRPPLLRGVPTAGGSFFEEIRGRAALPPETGPLPGSPLASGMGRGPVDALSRSKDVRPYGRRSRIPEDHPSAFGDPDRGRAPAEPVLGLRRAPWACPSGPRPRDFALANGVNLGAQP